MTIENKILLGNSIELPEMDPNDKKNDIEDRVSALHNYWFVSILNNINTDDFKQNYLCVINDIIEECSLEDQREFCNVMLEKIIEIYDFEFPEKISLNNIDEIKDLYYFFEFIEYNYSEFISNVWLSLNIDLSIFNINGYYTENDIQIINGIENEIETSNLNQLIKIFLRTYDKDKILLWFIKSSIKIKSYIKMKYLESRKEKI